MIGTYDDGSVWPPARSWGTGFAAGMRHALLVAEDHSFTFKTTDQRQHVLSDGRVFDDNPHLAYGPGAAR